MITRYYNESLHYLKLAIYYYYFCDTVMQRVNKMTDSLYKCIQKLLLAYLGDTFSDLIKNNPVGCFSNYVCTVSENKLPSDFYKYGKDMLEALASAKSVTSYYGFIMSDMSNYNIMLDLTKILNLQHLDNNETEIDENSKLLIYCVIDKEDVYTQTFIGGDIIENNNK